MSETQTRLATAIVVAPITLWVLWLGGLAWAIYVAVVAIICETEFFDIMTAKGLHPHRLIAYVVTVALILAALVGGMELSVLMLTVGILAILVMQLVRRTFVAAIPDTSVSMTGVLYIGWLLAHGVWLREMRAPDGGELGSFALLFALAVTFLGDTGGYFAGRAWGKHKIAPSISPKKSWEGLGGSIVLGAMAGPLFQWITEQWFFPVPIDTWLLALLGIPVVLIGFAGDLVESLIKRDAAVKDSGTLLPGHGGLLDRIDGVLFTVPLTYYLFVFLQRFGLMR